MTEWSGNWLSKQFLTSLVYTQNIFKICLRHVKKWLRLFSIKYENPLLLSAVHPSKFSFVSFITLNNGCSLTIPTNPCYIFHLHRLFKKVTRSYSQHILQNVVWMLNFQDLFSHNVSQKILLSFFLLFQV